MKKLYLSVLSLALVSSSVPAQSRSAVLQTAKQCSPSFSAIHPTGIPAHSSAAERDAFYSEDFSSGGLPAGWTTEDDMTPEGEVPVIFEWSDDPDAVTAAAANQPDILTFLASGATNGYLWANSDRGLASAPATNHLTRLTTSAIDCSGQSSVLLTMQSTIGVFDNNADEFVKVRVSTDLATWTDFFPFPCLETGDINPPCGRFSYNPQSVAINISSAAAGQSTVYLQFQWQGGWEYYWAIDDLELSPLPDNELVMNSGYTSQTGTGFEYGRVPAAQMLPTLNVGAEVFNFGANTQTNIVVNASLRDADDTEIGSATATVDNLAPGDTTVTSEFITLPNPMPTGIYTTYFTMTSDQIDLDNDPTNNSKERSFEVTDNVYSMDGIGVYPDDVLHTTQDGSGTGSYADNAQDVRFLNYYEVHSTMIATGVEIVLGSAAEAGSYFIASVYDTTSVLANDLSSPLAESDIHVITAGDIAAGKASVAFFDPISLDPDGYFVSANLFEEGGNDLYILDDVTVPQPNIASMLWIPNDDQNLYGGNGTAWAVRLSSDPNVSVQEHAGLQGVSIYPNPSNGLLNIHMQTAGNTSVEVFNVLGETVKTASFNGTSTTLDLSGNAAGMYSVRVGNGDNFTVQRIALN